jgi:O-Antigen ligase
MNAVMHAPAARWRSSDWYAAHARRIRVALGVAAAALAVFYAIAIFENEGDLLLLAPLGAALVGLAIVRCPVLGVYLVFGSALAFEQVEISGLAPITAYTRVFQNLSAYSSIPIRLSIIDLIILLTLASWLVRCVTRRAEHPRLGVFGWPLIGFMAALGLGLAIGISRGGGWDSSATLAELRGPVQMCLVYFLAANLIRDRGQLNFFLWELVAIVGLKALQGVMNYVDSLNLLYEVEAVTGHEDVIFFDLAIALMVVVLVLGIRTKLAYALMAVVPVALLAELFTQRRVGFIALAAVLVAIAILSFARNPGRGVLLAGLGAIALSAYLVVFWDQSGPLAQPVRALRAVIEPTATSSRDVSSGRWRDIENHNVAYTISQLPLTGVGLGQEYQVTEQPPPLRPKFTYWKNTTHNSLLWVWLKAGPIGALALWFLVARVLLVGSSLYMKATDPWIRLMVAVPVLLVVIHIAFSTVDLGFTYARTMIVFGAAVGVGASVIALASRAGVRGETA